MSRHMLLSCSQHHAMQVTPLFDVHSIVHLIVKKMMLVRYEDYMERDSYAANTVR